MSEGAKHVKFTPYLNFNGNCREAMEFYRSVFGGKIETMMTFGESPMGADVPEGERNAILHASLKVGDEWLLASDAPPSMGYQAPQGLAVTVALEDAAEGKRIFDQLAAGGTVTMPFDKTFWADGFGMCTDRYGIPWMVNCGPSA